MTFSSVRIPFSYGDCELSRVRTLAKKFLVWHAVVPGHLSKLGESLMARSHEYVYPKTDDAVTIFSYGHFPFLQLPKDGEIHASLMTACAEYRNLPRGHHESAELAACKEIGFHHDETSSEGTAYFAWLIESSSDFDFLQSGQSHMMRQGDLVVFDAQIPHALLRHGTNMLQYEGDNDEPRKFVYVLGTLRFGRLLCKEMGVKIERAKKISSGSGMRDVKYSELTGNFLTF